MQKKIIYTQKDIEKSGYAPITKKNLLDGMSVKRLCEAANRYSDNAAANLLIKILGGTKAVTDYARSIQDTVFRLDRSEPELNTAIPGDMRDTTTPEAIGITLKKLTLDNYMRMSQRKMLIDWLKNNTTGAAKIRAGIPKGWIVGDKTGSGDYGTSNDMAIIWPPSHAPIVMVIYLTQKEKKAKKHDKIIATVARLLISNVTLSHSCQYNW